MVKNLNNVGVVGADADFDRHSIPTQKRQTDTFWHSKVGEVFIDLFHGAKLWRLWLYMATSEIRRRYRRTLLGPFWSTLSLGIFIGSMSILFSFLWKVDIKSFLPYFSSGFICWTFIATLITESCSTFVAVEGLLKQISIPYSSFAYLLVVRNLLVLMHHSVIYVLVLILMPTPVNFNLLILFPAILLLSLTGLLVAIFLGLICARYRDLQQIIISFLQIAMFVTPIFWPISQLNNRRVIVFLDGNPLYHYINIVRMPLLGETPALKSWIITIGCTIVIGILTLWLFSRKRKHLIFWL